MGESRPERREQFGRFADGLTLHSRGGELNVVERRKLDQQSEHLDDERREPHEEDGRGGVVDPVASEVALDDGIGFAASDHECVEGETGQAAPNEGLA